MVLKSDLAGSEPLSDRPKWSQAILQPAKEFKLTPLPVIAGTIPPELTGSLYRNGPGRLTRGDKRVGHWFDGDGAVLGVHIKEGKATAVYRYVQTKEYQEETAAQKFLYPNYGMTSAGGWWENLKPAFKNVANTSVLPLSDRLLALWEGGLPHALDLQTLETYGKDNLAVLSHDRAFSAHPKVDSGEIFNFGISIGSKIVLNLYKCNLQGQITQQNTFALRNLSLIHDFVIAGDYLVFFIPPIKANLLPVMLGRKAFCDSMEWKPKLGTQILIFDRHSLSLVSQGTTEAWFQWHYTNGYVAEDGNLIVEFVRYRDLQTNQYLKEVATGKTTTSAKGTLWEIKIQPQTAKVISNSQILDRWCEFPVIDPSKVGKSWRYTYLSCHREGVKENQEILTAIARFDRQENKLVVADMGGNIYPSEPVYVPNADQPTTGWLLTVVYDANNHSSEVRIYNSDRLDADPICRLELPEVIPPSFHGTWLNQ
ncbi:MAG: carotenoid oxygenase family protein [Xenococcaceae cyanobacterium MO_167.B27]|nr:carotenoid oxygenase family protein [Xenococcaceae cyanobacterium MO_167.B27]